MSNVQLILGDCLQYLSKQPDKSVDCVVTDPPYGIDVGKMAMGKGKKKTCFASFEWDQKPPSNFLINEFSIFSISIDSCLIASKSVDLIKFRLTAISN